MKSICNNKLNNCRPNADCQNTIIIQNINKEASETIPINLRPLEGEILRRLPDLSLTQEKLCL